MRTAIISLAVLCSALAYVANAGESVYEREGHLTQLRKRLGHFEKDPFLDLYHVYAASFVKPKHPERANDDYRNYMPSGDECMIFFRKFRGDSYKLRDLDEFALLDACLGYLYDNEHQEADAETSVAIKNQLASMKDDAELKNLFDNTRVNELSGDGKLCISNLLYNSVLAKHQFQDVRCNNHYLQVYLQFAECQETIDESFREQDSYGQALYELLKKRVNTCFKVEVEHINRAVRLAYAKDKVRRIQNIFKKKASSLAAQEQARMWPKHVIRLLSAVQNTTNEVNLRQVHALVRGVVSEPHEPYRQIFLDNIGYYATKEISPRPNTKAEQKDPTGYMRYNDLVDEMCSFFRSSDKESDYDFATPIIRMVQLLRYEQLFGITQKEFLNQILTQAHETAPLYLSVSACNILTFTEATLAEPSVNTKQAYRVVFKPDTTSMVLWPDAGYF